MLDMKPTIIPKSDQLNSDDLIGGQTRTIRITGVRLVSDPAQPTIISYNGDKGKPYKPCLSMRKVLLMIWGDDGEKYVGHSITLYSDEAVIFGKDKVGGIRISHMTGLKEDRVMMLTASRGRKKPFTVKPLVLQQQQTDVAKNATTEPEKPDPITEQQAELLQTKIKAAGMSDDQFCGKMDIKGVADLDKTRLDSAHVRLDKKIKEESF